MGDTVDLILLSSVSVYIISNNSLTCIEHEGRMILWYSRELIFKCILCNCIENLNFEQKVNVKQVVNKKPKINITLGWKTWLIQM